MRALLYLEYLLNMLDGNLHAKEIYERGLNQLKLHGLLEEESATREWRENWYLQKLSERGNVLYRALYDSVKLELERAQTASIEIKERNKILADAKTTFEKIKEQYQEEKPHLKRRQQAAELIAREWKKRNDLKKTRDEGFEMLAEKDQFVLL